ncbi:EpsG family protein [Paraclostridium sordellii]|uniref:EpsG family protein n=1 Tax=Paraclostridium sordellii TaxID=1505 RepID=UPI0018C309C3|nr:EpsG family protein [Paeniclostridium sordellii]
MAYKFIPAPGNDLYRLFDAMHYYAGQDFNGFISSIKESSTPAQVTYFYIIGKLKIDGLLAGITTFIFYSNIFYILKKFANRYSISSKNTALALLFFMATGSYMEVISGIRTMLGFSIVAVCFYKEIIEGKSIFKNALWYIIAMFMHSAALAAIIIRIVFLVMENSKSSYKKLKLFIVMIISIVLILKFGNRYIVSMSEKIVEYITIQDGYSYFWEYIIGIIDILAIVFIQVSLYKTVNKNNEFVEVRNFYKFSNFVSIIVIISLFIEYNTFHRFVIFDSILISPILMFLLNSKVKNNKVIYNIIFAISIFMLCIACSRGNLCSLKFFI